MTQQADFDIIDYSIQITGVMTQSIPQQSSSAPSSPEMPDVKADILEAASQLFLEGGLEALSVRSIAKKANISTFGIYRHFKGKTGILDALYEEGFAYVVEALDVTIDSIDPKVVVFTACRNYLGLANARAAHYRLIFGEAGTQYTPSLEAQNAGRIAFKKLIELTSALLPETASDARKRQNALEIWAIVHGFVCFQNHAVTQMIPDVDWTISALAAVERHIKSL